MIKAQVLRSDLKFFECEILESKKVVNAVALGNLLKQDSIVVGDFVSLEQNEEEWRILQVLPRRNEMWRLLPREKKKKIVASNCDVMMVIVSASHPTYKRGLLDRYLLRSVQWEIPAIVIFNKMDQHDETVFDIKFEARRLEKLDIKIYEISATHSEYKKQFLSQGLEDLKKDLENKTTICMGQSGVGKSKLISLLSEGEANLYSQDLGSVNKGKHTTTWSELLRFKKFSLIDSPGIRSFSVEDVKESELLSLFPDLEEIARFCQFANCEHNPKAKACAFFNSQRPEEEQHIVLSRLDSYHSLLIEVAKFEDWEKK
ncbi:MAG: ribosome small subunit-dependent GTPase A [Bacteriovoracaceae bacterium]|nr:ribosome small subunit-dependent GTPase A [Bacteriovoracaceae bacterium]